MDELEKARQELEAVRRGEMKANDACEMVNHWLMLSVYDVAYSVATKKTKEERSNAMIKVKSMMPDFVDDVQMMAKKIFKNAKTSQHANSSSA